MRELAEVLATEGCTVLRFDLHGTGDSSGEQTDPHRLRAWHWSIAQAVSELRREGHRHVILIGLRLGATFSLLDGSSVGADAVVAWAPVTSGRRFVREITLLGDDVPDGQPGYPTGTICVTGSVFEPETLADLGRISPAEIHESPAPDILLLDRTDRPVASELVAVLEGLGATVDLRDAPGSELALDQPTEYAEVSPELIELVRSWHAGRPAMERRQDPSTAEPPTCRPTETLDVDGHRVTESAVQLGPHGLVGMATVPENPPSAAVVLLNSGSEPHIGPGRAWVEYGRQLAAAGYATVRADFSGWGESPDLGHAPGRPYDAHTIGETVEIVESLRQSGYEQVVLLGLCAGAWVALEAARRIPVDGVVAINPQLYWRPGDVVEADIVAETHQRRLGEIARDQRWARVGLWSALDAIGIRHRAATWLRQLGRAGVPVLMLFAEGDDGVDFLQHRVGRSWRWARRRGHIEHRILTSIDHPMHRHWLRPDVLAAIAEWLPGALREAEPIRP